MVSIQKLPGWATKWKTGVNTIVEILTLLPAPTILLKMTNQRKNSYILRNGYCLSYIQSLAKHQQRCSPSLCSYVMEKLIERLGQVPLVKRAKYFYYRAESEFLMLISSTLVTISMLTVVIFYNMILDTLMGSSFLPEVTQLFWSLWPWPAWPNSISL